MLNRVSAQMRRLTRGAVVLAFAGLLAGCAADAQLDDEPPVDLGDFSLGHNIVVAEGMQQGPFSRQATPDEVQAALSKAITERLGRYDGDKLYHIGLKVDAYAMAMPGVPVVFTPKSLLVVSANIWDDAAGKKLTDEPQLLTVFEGPSGSTLVGSGLTRNKAAQLEILSANMAKRVERWLLENGEWFGIDPSRIPEPLDDDPLASLGGSETTAK